MATASISYEQWTELLGSFFFDPSHDGSEILFAVDDLALSEITGLSELQAATSLAEAVLGVIGRDWDVRQVKFRVRRWKVQELEGDHPSLPFLALTVLAASRMHANETYRATNYYVPLRTTLNPSDKGQGTPGNYLEYVRELWDSLAVWANEDLRGERGRLVLRDPGPQYGRGAAVQHALVRSSDLSHLDAFFRRIGLQPGEGAIGRELLRALTAWTAPRHEAWAKRLHRLCSDAELSEYASALLEREAARWDGRPRDQRTGRGVGQIRVGIGRLRSPDLALYLCGDSRLPTELQISPPRSEPLIVTQSGDWFEPSPLPHDDIGAVLSEGLRVPAGQWRFEFRPEDAYPLTYDDDLGQWVSVDTISFGDKYHILVRDHLAPEVRKWMRQVSALPLKEDAATQKQLPPGWVLLQDLQLERRPTSSPPACLSASIPTGLGPRLRLVGGLPLSAGHAVFLRGGEPGVALSSLVSDPRLTITHEESGMAETLHVGENHDEEIPLWNLQLAPGNYRIQHGETTVSFTIVDGIAEVAGPGAGTVALTTGTTHEVIGSAPKKQLDVRGPVTVQAPKEGLWVYVIGHQSSEFIKVETPDRIKGLFGELTWSHLDLWSDFVPVWQITKKSSTRFIVDLLNCVEPSAECDEKSDWARLIRVASLADTASETAQKLWTRYQSVAGVTA